MYLVSACLAGMPCRYDGKANFNPDVVELVNMGQAIPICPEQLGGLTTPRVPCEMRIQEDSRQLIYTKDGKDCTKAFQLGAERTVAVAKSLGITRAILKAKSPSCGCGKIYDGTFSGKLIDGDGLTTKLLKENGIEVVAR